MSASLKEETTFVLLKPDSVKRGLVGEIVKRIEQRGLKVVACTMLQTTKQQIDKHYPKDEKWIRRLGEKTANTYAKYNLDLKKELGTADLLEIGKMVRNWMLDFMISGPVVKMAVQGLHAIDMVRKLCGNTMPFAAELGSIRGDFSVDSAALANAEKRPVFNLIHASENPEEAKHELKLWFKAGEIHSYKRVEE